MRSDKLAWNDATVLRAFPCATCAHRMMPPLPVRCAAFPNEVPEQIRNGSHDHRTPFDGDRGIQWTPHPRDLPLDEQMPR